MYQPNCCRENDPTINRPHASRPTPNQPGMQGWKSEHGLATPWCATTTDDHTHECNTTPQIYHYTTDQPTATNYFRLPATRESASSTESGGVSMRHGMRVP